MPEKEKGIEKKPTFIIEHNNIKMTNLQKTSHKFSVLSLTSIKTTTDLYKAMEEYENKFKNYRKKYHLV